MSMFTLVCAVRECDVDGDGRITCAEFVKLFTDKHSAFAKQSRMSFNNRRMNQSLKCPSEAQLSSKVAPIIGSPQDNDAPLIVRPAQKDGQQIDLNATPTQ